MSWNSPWGQGKSSYWTSQVISYSTATSSVNMNCKIGNLKSSTFRKSGVGCFESHVPNLRLIKYSFSFIIFRNVSQMIFYICCFSIHFPPCALKQHLDADLIVVIKTRLPFSRMSSSLWCQELNILMVWSVFTAVEPPVSNHPKYKDLVVAYGRWSLRRFSPWGSLLRRSPCSDEQSVQLFHSNVGHMRAVLVYVARTLFKFKMLHVLLFTWAVLFKVS